MSQEAKNWKNNDLREGEEEKCFPWISWSNFLKTQVNVKSLEFSFPYRLNRNDPNPPSQFPLLLLLNLVGLAHNQTPVTLKLILELIIPSFPQSCPCLHLSLLSVTKSEKSKLFSRPKFKYNRLPQKSGFVMFKKSNNGGQKHTRTPNKISD